MIASSIQVRLRLLTNVRWGGGEDFEAEGF